MFLTIHMLAYSQHLYKASEGTPQPPILRHDKKYVDLQNWVSNFYVCWHLQSFLDQGKSTITWTIYWEFSITIIPLNDSWIIVLWSIIGTCLLQPLVQLKQSNQIPVTTKPSKLQNHIGQNFINAKYCYTQNQHFWLKA